MNSELIDEERVKMEAKRQNDYLNSAIGLISFTLGLACLSLPNPQRAALLCLGIVLPSMLLGLQYFPPTVQAVRSLAKETRDPEVMELKRYLDRKYYGVRSAISKNLIYLYGITFFALVLFSPDFVAWVTAS